MRAGIISNQMNQPIIQTAKPAQKFMALERKK
jgi:hypothetical protein